MTQTDTQNATPQKVDSFEVGWLFVQEYYTFLNKDPKKLHQFYNKKSYFLHGQEGETAKLCHGQADIYEQIMKLGFVDCKVLVSNVDSQASLNGGIIVQVLGELSNRGLPCHKFAQTFFLAEQPSGYYVLNDIFRFLKEDIDNDYEVTTEPTAEPQISDFQENLQEFEEPVAPASPEPVIESEPIVEKLEVPKETSVTTPAPESVETVIEPVVETKKEAPIVEKAPPAANGTLPPVTPKKSVPANIASTPAAKQTQQPAQQSQQPQQTQQQQQQKSAPAPKTPQAEASAPSTPSKPTSWASLAAKGQVAPISPPQKATNATAPPKMPGLAPQHGTSSVTTTTMSQDGSVLSVDGGSGDEGGKDQFQTIHGRNSRQNRNSYQNANGSAQGGQGDIHSMYVADIPPETTNAQIRALFGKAGTITKLDYVKTKNIAFVDFETAEGLQKAVAQSNIINGKELRVEERRIHRTRPNYERDGRGQHYESGNRNNGYRNGRGGGRGSRERKEHRSQTHKTD